MNNPNNLLHQETSPYLLQHADNPVNWQAWNTPALTLAKQQNKPVLLSIGYSACHWCHVMAHESFEDPATAEIMNRYFINIKVDREERPDLDKIYQTAHSMLTGRSGGWPLTVFLMPDDQMPFFAGTYFPKERRYGMPAFSEILHAVNNIFHNRKTDIAEQNQSLKDMLERLSEHDSTTTKTLNALPLDLARKQIMSQFDYSNGGFSNAPKFPHPSTIERTMRHWAAMQKQQHQDEDILDAALFTLQKMAMGGIFDHLGGGFCRYSTDDLWMIPHFEKMLYDNGQLLCIYAQAYQIDARPVFRNAIEMTADWVMREMQSRDGGFYSAQDADSEGEEGKFYIWTPEEVKQHIHNEKHYAVFARCYGLNRPANFENHWHLHQYESLAQVAQHFTMTESEISDILQECKQILFKIRQQRVVPGRDDKVLTSWNALMIRGMSWAGRVLNREDYITSARAALSFIKTNLWPNKRLLATYKDGKAHLNAYLDDYAYLLLAIMDYLQCRWDNELTQWSYDIAETLLQQFEDKQRGGFFFTSHDHEQLIQRSKTFTDEAIPSGNGIAAFALQRLGLITGNTDYLKAAENCIKAGAMEFQQHAIVCGSLLHALEEYLDPPTIIIIRGQPTEMKNWQAIINSRYMPNILCYVITSDIEPIAPLHEKTIVASCCAYICEGTHCLPAITNIDIFRQYIHQHTASLETA
ncbi:MAG: thioredoxin domain-containing protein [Gammaproteobacteria bacterium]|nr:MAG: thioredoxin domain-containing protein [Gammaproteobacteria bacterium]